MDAYVTRLRTLAKTCQFGTSLDEMIRDQIIEKCESNALRRRLLGEREFTLDDLLPIARSFELADRQALEMEQKFESSTHLNSIERKRDFQQSRRNSAKREDNNKQKSVCYCCGNEGHRAKDAECPALNKTCRRCGKSGHFVRVCRQTTPSQRVIGKMLDSLNNPTTTHPKMDVYLLSQPIMCIIARTAFIRWKLNTFLCKCSSTRVLVLMYLISRHIIV